MLLFIVFSYVLLYFYISCFISFFISYIVYLRSLSFLLGEPGQRFISYVYPFKDPAFGFIDFLYCFLNFYFIYFLPSADLKFYFFLLFLIILSGR